MIYRLLFTRSIFFFFFNDTATTEIYTLSLHDALPIWRRRPSSASSPTTRSPRRSTTPPRTRARTSAACACSATRTRSRSEEHTSELQSPCNLVCRLLLEKKKNNQTCHQIHELIINVWS